MLLAFQNFIRRRERARKVRRQRLKSASLKRILRYRRVQHRRTKTIVNSVLLHCMKPSPERKVWCEVRSESWWEDIVKRQFNDNDWVKNFRMSRDTFEDLCKEVSPYLQKQDTKFRKAISIDKRVAVSLWRLSTNCEYQTIGHLFGISKSAVCDIVKEFCFVVNTHLLSKYICIPKDEDLVKVVREFEIKWGFPQTAGAIDGSHIPIKAPVRYHADYYNRKGWYSIVLQGAVDSFYRFIDINVGWPGKVHDARVFANSSIGVKAGNGSLFPEEMEKEMTGIKVPSVLLGDAAYPLLPRLMKPFPDYGNLTPSKLHYNYRLSRARMVVENAFGRLKGRWRCLLKENEANIGQMSAIVSTCCVLHNICEVHREAFDTTLMEQCQSDNEPDIDGRNVQDRVAAAANILEVLVKYCTENRIGQN